MLSRILLKTSTLLAVVVATLSLARSSAAQGESGMVFTECGAGVIEACGETVTHECGWEWAWSSVPFFPYRSLVPLYECDVSTRDLMYRHYARGGLTPIEH